MFKFYITDTITDSLAAERCSSQVWYDYLAEESRAVLEEIVARMEEKQEASFKQM